MNIVAIVVVEPYCKIIIVCQISQPNRLTVSMFFNRLPLSQTADTLMWKFLKFFLFSNLIKYADIEIYEKSSD